MPDDLANIPGAEDPTARVPLPLVSRLRIRGATADGKVPESTAGRYFLIRGGQKTGPFKREEVSVLLRTGQASPRDLGWQEGQSGWRPLSELLPGVGPVMRSPTANAAVARPDAHDDLDRQSFGALLFGSLAYPFQGDGLIILLVGGLVLTAVNFLAGFLVFISLIIAIFSTGYLFGALQIIVRSSAQGDPELPNWPAFEVWTSEVVQPILLWLSTLVACFGPALLAAALAWHFEDMVLTGFAAALGLGGFLYYPMALLGVALTDSLAGMNPVLVFCSISRVPGRYAAAVAVLVLVMTVQILGGVLAETFPSKAVGYIWNSFNSLYFAIVQARILGLLYYANREKLAWF